MGISEVFLYAGMVLRFPIYFLLMTVSCFVEQRRRSAKIFLIYSRSMKEVQGQKKKKQGQDQHFFQHQHTARYTNPDSKYPRCACYSPI